SAAVRLSSAITVNEVSARLSSRPAGTGVTFASVLMPGSYLALVRNAIYFSSCYHLLLEVIMHAAVVTAFGSPPASREFPVPEPSGPDQVLADVLAAGLHPRVRSQGDGSHYT